MIGTLVDRLTHPVARVKFASNGLILLMDGVPTLMFRAANEGASPLLNAEVRIFLSRTVRTREGHWGRRLSEIEVPRNSLPIYQLSWNI
jgi:inward rectifier potassium channel